MIAGKSLLEHFTDSCGHDFFVARNSICFLLDKQRDVRILFKTVTDAVEMQVETLLPQFSQHGFDGEAFQIRTNDRRQQIRLRYSRRKSFTLSAVVPSQSTE